LFYTFFCCKTKIEELNAQSENVNFTGSIDLIEIPQELKWLNSSSPISLSKLKGKIVLLYFWNYSNINSFQSLQKLKKLEKKYSKELFIIGIHTGKFSYEKEIETLQHSILKLEINFPVVHDPELKVMSSYLIQTFPSFVLINPIGKVLGKHTGEDFYSVFEQVILNTINEFEKKNLLNRTSIELELEKDKLPDTVLSYPSKIILNEKGNEIYISDTNHNRILRIDIGTRKILDIIGSGQNGFEDGLFKDAKLNQPRGIYLKENYLYIADTNNHSIRRADINSKKLITLAGNGEQAIGFNGIGKGRQASFHSPWDLVEYKNKLYITTSGSHQIWSLDLNSLETENFAGSGRENLFDEKLTLSALARPSGITRDETKLYFTDSGVSAIRLAEIKKEGEIKTLLGKGLFEFGDVDGNPHEARLQFPLGLHYNSFKLYIADSFNHKIKFYDIDKKEVYTLSGTGKPSQVVSTLSESGYNEPSSLFSFKNLLYIADTNNHSIKILDTKTNLVKLFDIDLDERLFFSRDKNFQLEGDEKNIPDLKIHPDSTHISLNFNLETGYKWMNQAPYYFKTISSNNNNISIQNKSEEVSNNPIFPKLIKLKPIQGESMLKINSILFYSESTKNSLCLIKKSILSMKLTVSPDGVKNPNLNLKIHSIK
jgi:DNA-binding beta-propeller fold protein YncE